MPAYRLRQPESRCKGKRAVYASNVPRDRRLVRAINSYIIATQRKDFHLGVRIAGVKVYAKLRKDGTMSRFTFAQPRRAPIKLYTRYRTMLPTKLPSKLDAADIEVCVRGAWIPFLTWIDIEYGLRYGPNYTLFDWWSTNGQSFRFMDLPYELRDCIYKQVTTPYTWPHINVMGKYSKCTMATRRMHLWGALFRRAPSGHAPPVPTNLPSVSKQVAAEFHRVAENYSIPHFLFPEHLQMMIPYPKMANSLRRISLGMPNWMYFKLLGYEGARMKPFDVVHDAPSITMLRSIDTLEHINFHFQIAETRVRPDGYVHSWDPWINVGPETHHQVSCQKAFVDMFLLFALKHIRHIPRITLSGHVKDSTKEDWAEIFRAEAEGDDWDVSDEIAWWLSRPFFNFPLTCYCKNPCNYWMIQGPHPEGYKKPQYSPHDWNYDPGRDDPFICED